MKRLFLLAMGTGLGLALATGVNLGRAQLPATPVTGPAPGPGPEGAVLKNTFDPSAAPTGAGTVPGTGALPPSVQSLFPQGANARASSPLPPIGQSQAVSDTPGVPMHGTGLWTMPPYQEKPDPNRDIAITPTQGPWVVYIDSYTGPEAPTLARQMAMELRSTYRLNAYVYNHGAEERRKEYERVRAIVQ